MKTSKNRKLKSAFVIFSGTAALVTIFDFLTPASMPIFDDVVFDACTSELRQRKSFLSLIDRLSENEGSTVFFEEFVINEAVPCDGYSANQLYFDDRGGISLSLDNLRDHKFQNESFYWNRSSLSLKLPDFWERSEYGQVTGGENSYILKGPVSVVSSEVEETLEFNLILGNVSGGAYQEYLCTKKVNIRGYLIGKLGCMFKF